MKIESSLTDDTVLRELGNRLAAARLSRNLTQAALAAQAGVAKRTIERLESGAVATQLSGFLRVCRALDLIDRLELLVPDAIPSPIATLKLQGRQRQRASTRQAAKPSKAWEWGDS